MDKVNGRCMLLLLFGGPDSEVLNGMLAECAVTAPESVLRATCYLDYIAASDS